VLPYTPEDGSALNGDELASAAQDPRGATSLKAVQLGAIKSAARQHGPAQRTGRVEHHEGRLAEQPHAQPPRKVAARVLGEVLLEQPRGNAAPGIAIVVSWEDGEPVRVARQRSQSGTRGGELFRMPELRQVPR